MSSVRWAGGGSVYPQVPFRRLFTPAKRDVPPDAEIVTAYADGRVTLRSNRSKIGYHEAADLSGYQGVHVGDLVVHGLDILRGSVGVSESSGAMSSVCTVLPPSDRVDGRYVAWVIRAQAQSGYTRVLARGIREGGADFRRWDTLGELPIILPPLEEQRRIADFLDDQVARIDSIIEGRRRQAEVLEQRHLAHIYDMFSGRLDQGSRRDLPGLAWLESIPSGWSVMSVGQLFSVQLGQMLNDERARGTDLAPYLRNANVTWHEVRAEDLLEMSFAPEARRRYRVRAGDLLVCEGGAGIAEAAVVPRDLDGIFYSKALHRVRSKAEVPVEWLLNWLMLAKKTGVFEAEGQLTTIPHLPAEQLRLYKIPVPPDVVARCAELERGWQTSQGLSERLNSSVELLREMKGSLIAAAVSGQFDVSSASGLGASA